MQMTYASPQQVSSAQETSDTSQGTKKYSKPHMIIPDEDMAWALEQRLPVYKLWGECWRSDPYGSRWMPLKTTLGRENLKKAKKPLIDAGLFLFENRLTVVDGKRCYEWWVKNLHGCRSAYWKFKGVEITQDQEDIDNPYESIKSTEAGNQDTEVGNHSTTQNEEGIDRTDLGIDDNYVGIESTGAGRQDTQVGNHNTPQPYLKSLTERVLESLINVSGTLHKHFSISLTIEERGEFLNFCLKKIAALQATGFEVRTDHAWIAKHYEQYWKEFQDQRGITCILGMRNWADHPFRTEWLDKIRSLGFAAFIYEEGHRDKQREEFYRWAKANNLIWGVKS